ncbi:MAG: CoA transferase [Acidobacteriota bacterium]
MPPKSVNVAPLAGLRVIDASRVLAGPYLAMLLGDLGADVIKIERPGEGDPTRAWGPPFVGSGDARTSAYFVSANRNKRSLALDLKQAAGRKVWRRLLDGADIVVENFLPRDWKSLRLGSSHLTRRYSRIIQCTITGYGASGPQTDRPAYDLALQAESGLMAITGFSTGEPVRVGVAIVDFLAALYGLNGLLAALYARERTGRGQRVEVAMADAATAFLGYAAQSWLTDGSEAARMGSAHPNLVPYRAFAASDGWFAVAVGSEAQWRRFCQAIGDAELAAEPRFKDNAARVLHRMALERRLAKQFASAPREDWLVRLLAHRVPAAPVATLDAAMRQAIERGAVQALPAGVYGVLRSIAPPFLFDGRRPRLERSAPGLGEHSEAILSESGFSKREIAALLSAAVIG